MKVYADKEEYKWFKNMADEGRTRILKITSYPMKKDNSEIELNLQN